MNNIRDSKPDGGCLRQQARTGGHTGRKHNASGSPHDTGWFNTRAKGVMPPPRTWPPTCSERGHVVPLECKKTFLQPELHPGPRWGTLQHSSRPLAVVWLWLVDPLQGPHPWAPDFGTQNKKFGPSQHDGWSAYAIWWAVEATNISDLTRQLDNLTRPFGS